MRADRLAFRAETTRALAHGLLAQLVGCGVAHQLGSRTSLPALVIFGVAAVLGVLAVALALRVRRSPPPDLVTRAVAHTLFGGGFLGFVFCAAVLSARGRFEGFDFLELFAIAFGSAGVVGYLLLKFVLRTPSPGAPL
jgi:FtsH-binding integral membrane protein